MANLNIQYILPIVFILYLRCKSDEVKNTSVYYIYDSKDNETILDLNEYESIAILGSSGANKPKDEAENKNEFYEYTAAENKTIPDLIANESVAVDYYKPFNGVNYNSSRNMYKIPRNNSYYKFNGDQKNSTVIENDKNSINIYNKSISTVNINDNIKLHTGPEHKISDHFKTEYTVVNDTTGNRNNSVKEFDLFRNESVKSFDSAEIFRSNKVFRESHACSRKCVKGEKPMECYYKFDVEWYYSMSKACHNCKLESRDCFRPDCIPTDGMKRAIIVVNHTLPGPSIEVCLGDNIIVDVHNHLIEETTTIHWHGLHQKGSPYMDGVPFVTQCPISPNSVFRYNFVAANAGTHFWHSHTGCQRTDGAVGNMIIRVPREDDPLSHWYDEDLNDHVINVMDWAHELGVIMFLAHYHSDGDNKPETILVNGKGRYFADSKNVTSTPLATFHVKQGVRYRFRLINSGNQNCPIELSIDNHTIIAVNSDGGNFKPVVGAALVSYAGERWDFILIADKKVSNYWMRFKGLMDCDERFTKAHQVAVLHYEGAPHEEPAEPVSYFGPTKLGKIINAMNVKLDDQNSISVPQLETMENYADPSLIMIADHQLYIAYDFYPVNTNSYHKATLYGFNDVKNPKERVYTPQFNHISMKMPSIPLLPQRDSVNSDMLCDHKRLKNCSNEIHCYCTNVINIGLGDTVELILIDEGNTYNANHPFHLHGHPFRVVGMDRLGENTSVETVRELDRKGKLGRNLISAPIKDTVTVPDGGYTIVRFHASNPGYWLFHCHLEFHVEVGMALIFKVGEHSQFPSVPEGFPKCGPYLNPKTTIEKLYRKKDMLENELYFGEDFRLNSKYRPNNNEVAQENYTQNWISFKIFNNSSTSNRSNSNLVLFFTLLYLLFNRKYI